MTMAKKTVHISTLFDVAILIREPHKGSAREFEIQAARLSLLVMTNSHTGAVIGTLRRDGLSDRNGNHFDD